MTTRWILLRGLAREAAHWGPLAQRLEQALGRGHVVQALDLPGSGARRHEACPGDVAAIAQACRPQVAGDSPVVLVAMSLGAMVALEWSRAAPQAVAGCVLINTSAGGTSPFWARLRPANYLRIARLLAWPADPLSREREILAMTSADPSRHAQAAERWAEIARQRPMARTNAARQLLAAARYRAPPRPPAVPLLLLASRGDRLVSPQCSARLAQAWQRPIAWHPWAGHDLPLDDPDWVVGSLVGWRARLG